MYTEVRLLDEALTIASDWLKEGFTVEIVPVNDKFRVKRN